MTSEPTPDPNEVKHRTVRWLDDSDWGPPSLAELLELEPEDLSSVLLSAAAMADDESEGTTLSVRAAAIRSALQVKLEHRAHARTMDDAALARALDQRAEARATRAEELARQQSLQIEKLEHAAQQLDRRSIRVAWIIGSIQAALAIAQVFLGVAQIRLAREQFRSPTNPPAAIAPAITPAAVPSNGAP